MAADYLVTFCMTNKKKMGDNMVCVFLCLCMCVCICVLLYCVLIICGLWSSINIVSEQFCVRAAFVLHLGTSVFNCFPVIQSAIQTSI